MTKESSRERNLFPQIFFCFSFFPSQFLMQRWYRCRTLSYLNCLRPRGKHCLCFPGTVLCNVQRRNNICLKADFGVWILDLHLSALPFAHLLLSGSQRLLSSSTAKMQCKNIEQQKPCHNAMLLSSSTATMQCKARQ